MARLTWQIPCKTCLNIRFVTFCKTVFLSTRELVTNNMPKHKIGHVWFTREELKSRLLLSLSSQIIVIWSCSIHWFVFSKLGFANEKLTRIAQNAVHRQRYFLPIGSWAISVAWEHRLIFLRYDSLPSFTLGFRQTWTVHVTLCYVLPSGGRGQHIT